MAVKSPRGSKVHPGTSETKVSSSLSAGECIPILESFRRVLNEMDVRIDTFNAIIKAKMEINRLSKVSEVGLKALGEIALMILAIGGRQVHVPSSDDDILVDDWIEMRYVAAINLVMSS